MQFRIWAFRMLEIRMGLLLFWELLIRIRTGMARGLGHLARNCTVRPRRRDAAYLQTHLLIAQKEEEESFLVIFKHRLSIQEQYTDLLEPIPEPHQVQQNDSNVISDAPSVEQNGGTVEQSPATVEETRALYDSLYNNLEIEVDKVKSVNRKMKETNAELFTELARYKNQEKINALHLSSDKQITTLNEEISNLNKQLSKEKSTISSLLEENKRLKSDFKIREDELLDKQIQLENKIKELDNILVKTGQSIQTMHMLSPKPDSFYHTEHKMALGYQNPFYLKQAQQKQQSLYNGKVLLEKHDPPTVYDSEETLQLAQESRLKMKQLNKEIKPANYTKINHLSGVFVSQTAKSREESYFTNTSKTATVSKSISIPNEEFSDDTTPSVARKFLNEIKRLQAQLGDLKGKSKDILCASNTLDPLSQKLENENVELEFQVVNYLRAQLFDKASEQKETNKGTSVNTKFANQSILGKPFLQPIRNNFVIRQPNAFKSERPKFSNNRVPQKVDKTNDLSKPVTSNSVPITNESNVVKNDNVIALGMFRIDHRKTFREDKFVPINKVRASVRTNPITVSQPHVITKKDVNSDSNGLSSTGVDNIAKTRRPQPRSNTKNDRVPSASKIRCFKNNEVKVEEHHRNFLLSKNKKHMSSEGNNVKLAIRNDNSEVVCAIFWLWHQRLSHLNFDIINDLARNDLVTGLPKFKYHKEHLCPSCEQGKSKRASHPPKPVPNSKQRLHLLHMDLCGPMRIASINGKRYVLVIVDDYSRYTWVHFLRSKDEAPEVIKTFLKRITVLLQSPNGVVEQRNRMLVEAARTMLIFSRAPLFLWAEAIATMCYTQNRSIIYRRFNKTPYELINGRKPDISILHVFGALCYPKNDREDIGKLGAKGLDLTYALSIITTQQPTEGELDLLFEAMYDDHIGGQLSAAPRTVLAAQPPRVLQTPMTSTSIADTAPRPTNSSSQATNIPNTSQDVDELETQQ
ncbi:retrovirus-related pol polyprotein from transposon TNT 1-94 [Tanacetum coccineum]